MNEVREQEILRVIYQVLKETVRGDEMVVKDITVKVFQALLEQNIIK
jgi:hypothetical protein